jgi:hypothetical protein
VVPAPPIAQADVDGGPGAYVLAGIGTSLDGRTYGPLQRSGDARVIEAGALIPGGSVFVWTLGLRGASFGTPPDPRAAHRAFEVVLLAGARIDLLREPTIFEWMPQLRGGFHAGIVRDKLQRGRDDRVALGPDFGLAISGPIGLAATWSAGAEAHASIAPLTLTLIVTLAITAQTPL